MFVCWFFKPETEKQKKQSGAPKGSVMTVRRFCVEHNLRRRNLVVFFLKHCYIWLGAQFRNICLDKCTISRLRTSLRMRIKYKDAYHYWTKPQCCQLSDFVAIFSYFSDPFGDFFSKQRQATNLAPFSAAIGDFWRLFEVKALSLLPLHNEHRVPARPLPRLNALTGSSVLVVKSKLRNRMSLQTLNSILYIRYGLKLSGDACFEQKLPDHDLKLFGTSAAYSFKVAPTAEPGCSREPWPEWRWLTGSVS